jgi:hypothetical protein
VGKHSDIDVASSLFIGQFVCDRIEVPARRRLRSSSCRSE